MNTGILKIWLVLLINIILNTSFYLPPDRNSPPARDLGFIRRYSCISDLFDKEQWTDNKGRSFDPEGIHLTNGKKHPVNACHYAFFCYDKFRETGDEQYKKAFLAQISYLRDSTSYHRIEDDKVAYPYNIVFHDLKPPWYSALAQSEAISVMIRYYALTKDTTILPLITHVRNFMVAPQEGRCGTKSTTPEGFTWYEEYPESKQERQVLNGFFVTIIALYEYSMLFPENVEARMQYEEAVRTVKATFHHYDTGSWLRYNRGDKRQVGNGYMKWQVLELRLLYEITGDKFFKDAEMLVASYCYNKTYDTPGSRLKDYDFSVPLSEGKNGHLVFEGKKQNVDLAGQVSSIKSNFKNKSHEFQKLTDANQNSFVHLKADSTAPVEKYLRFNFKTIQSMASAAITFHGIDSLKKPSFDVYYSDSSEGAKRHRLKILNTIPEAKTVTVYFQPVQATSFTIILEDVDKYKDIKISNIAISSPVEKVKSDYWHYITPAYKGSGEIELKYDTKGMKSVVVLYKKAKDEKNLAKELWSLSDAKRKNPVQLRGDSTMWYRFLVLAEPSGANSVIKNLRFEP